MKKDAASQPAVTRRTVKATFAAAMLLVVLVLAVPTSSLASYLYIYTGSPYSYNPDPDTFGDHLTIQFTSADPLSTGDHSITPDMNVVMASGRLVSPSSSVGGQVLVGADGAITNWWFQVIFPYEGFNASLDSRTDPPSGMTLDAAATYQNNSVYAYVSDHPGNWVVVPVAPTVLLLGTGLIPLLLARRRKRERS